MSVEDDAVRVLIERELEERFKAISSELEKALSNIDKLTAKNIELSRDMTAAESRVRELEKILGSEKKSKESSAIELEKLRGEISGVEEKNATLEKNLEAVLKTKDKAMAEANKEAREAKSALREMKKEKKELAIKLDQLEKQTLDEKIGAIANRLMPKQYLIEKDLQGGFVANVVYEGEEPSPPSA